MGEPAGDLLATAPVESGAPYILSIRYRLESGRAKFALVDGESGNILWDYPIQKTSSAYVEREAVVRPQTSTCRLGIVLEPGARLDIASATLRPINRPTFELVPWQRQSEGPVEVELDEQTRRQLEALGYVN